MLGINRSPRIRSKRQTWTRQFKIGQGPTDSRVEVNGSPCQSLPEMGKRRPFVQA